MSDGLRADPAGDSDATARGRRVVPPQSLRGQRALAVLTVGIALTAGIALVPHLTDDDDRSAAAQPPGTTGRSSTPSTTDTNALAQWLRANLPAATPVIADPTATGLLRGAGHTGATNDVTACRAGTLVLLTEAMRRSARQNSTLDGCIDDSYAIAAQGDDQVREVATDLPAVLRARSAALALQKRGGAALAQNPSITMPSGVRTTLIDGRLDLRAEAVLSELSARTPLRLLAIDDVAAETRAGMPARTVEITVSDLPVVEPRLREVAAGYRPSQITQAAPNTLRLTWPFRTDPPPVLD